MSFLGELKKRKVMRVAVAYAVIAWALIEVVSTIEEPLGLPDWMDTFVIVLFGAGFPLALVLSWMFDLTSRGIVRTPAGDETEPASSAAGAAAGVAATGDAVPGKAAESAAEKPEVLPNSIAVLPLENLSPNPDDAYFAAGIHEEILNYLAKIEDLSVIARTSVRRYAGTDKPIAEIAAELGVGTIMEGSVRYAGDRVRVTTQLIDAASENHLWSESYERELADVFAIQADIATHVATALKARLTAVEKQNLEGLPTTRSSEAHALFLKAQALFSQGDTAMAVTTPPSVRASIHTLLERVLGVDPAFAPPYAVKALLYAISRIYDPVDKEDWTSVRTELDESVVENARRALELAPTLGMPYFALALNHQFNWRWREARAEYERALELKPNDAYVLCWYAALEWLTDELEAAVRLGRRAYALDPANAWANLILGCSLHARGDHEGAVAVYAEFSAAHPESSLPYLHRVLAEIALGREDRALEQLELATRLMPLEAAPAIHLHLAYLHRRLGLPDKAGRLVRERSGLFSARFVDPIIWVMGNLARGDREAALETFAEALATPEVRQEIFVRDFIMRNAWQEPILEEAEFVALRQKLRPET